MLKLIDINCNSMQQVQQKNYNLKNQNHQCTLIKLLKNQLKLLNKYLQKKQFKFKYRCLNIFLDLKEQLIKLLKFQNMFKQKEKFLMRLSNKSLRKYLDKLLKKLKYHNILKNLFTLINQSIQINKFLFLILIYKHKSPI